MGCGGGIKTPYEECAFLLREYELILRKRKDNIYTKKEKDNNNLDKNAKYYKSTIYENLEKINNNIKSDLEAKKLKQLNELFQVLLTEESQIYNNNKKEEEENEIIIKNENNNNYNKNNINSINIKNN